MSQIPGTKLLADLGQITRILLSDSGRVKNGRLLNWITPVDLLNEKCA